MEIVKLVMATGLERTNIVHNSCVAWTDRNLETGPESAGHGADRMSGVWGAPNGNQGDAAIR